MRLWRSVTLSGMLAVTLDASPSAAGYHAFGEIQVFTNNQSTFLSPYDVSSATQAGDGRTLQSGGEIQARASSLADSGGLRVNAHGGIHHTNPSSSFGGSLIRQGRAFAVGTYEVTITGPSGPVMTSLNMHLSGQVDVTSTNTQDGLNGGSGGVGVDFRVDGVLVSTVPQAGSGSLNVSAQDGGTPTTIRLGDLEDWTSPDGDITSAPFTVQAGTPFVLEITLSGFALATCGAQEQLFLAEGNSDFGSTLRFPTSGPVFNLPAGYTATSADAGITDNQVPCTSDCTVAGSSCDAGKTKCVTKRQACLLAVHAAAEKDGVVADAAKLAKCTDAFDGGAKGEAKGCVGKLEAKQKANKPKTRCSATNQLADLEQQIDAFVADVVSAIDPQFPGVGDPSGCDAGKKKCVAKRAACLLAEQARAGLKNVQPDPAKLQKCTDAFDGGAKGFAKGCIGKLEAKQDPAKPKTLCSVTGDLATLATKADAFVAAAVAAIRDASP